MEAWIVVDYGSESVDDFDTKQEAMDHVKSLANDGEDISDIKIYKVVEAYVPETSVEFVKEK